MIKDIPIKESHIITFVSSPVFTFGVRLLLSPDGSSETGGVFVVIGGIDSFLNLGSLCLDKKIHSFFQISVHNFSV